MLFRSLGLFQPILALNDAIMVFLNYFAIFLEFSITHRVGTEQNESKIFILCFAAFSNLFWLEKKP